MWKQAHTFFITITGSMLDIYHKGKWNRANLIESQIISLFWIKPKFSTVEQSTYLDIPGYVSLIHMTLRGLYANIFPVKWIFILVNIFLLYFTKFLEAIYGFFCNHSVNIFLPELLILTIKQNLRELNWGQFANTLNFGTWEIIEIMLYCFCDSYQD